MEIFEHDASDLIAKLSDKTLSCAEVMAAFLGRIEATNAQVNALVSMRDTDELMAEAHAADQKPCAGALHGIPIAIKDLAETKGVRTTFGSPLFADFVPDHDCGMVSRLKAAGAIVIGKSNTPEWGLGSHSYNPVHGVTRNPYDLGKSAGGSSGGAAAALAARMLPLADGSDMMGSLRNPAAWCNVYGFRPTWGRVPADPVGDVYLHRLATEGPMARSIRDLHLLLEVLETGDPRWPNPPLPPITPLKTAERGRLAWLGDWGGALPFEAGVIELCQTALGQFGDIGFDVDLIDAPHSLADIWQSWITLRSFSVAAKLRPLYNDPAKPSRLKPEAIWEIERGLDLSADDIQSASLLRTAWFHRALELFQTCDALLLPSAQVFPFDADLDWPKWINDVEMDTYHRWMEVVVPASLLGLPALNVPVGFHDGLPMGMQIIGKPGADDTVLAIGEAWHQATHWPTKQAPIL